MMPSTAKKGNGQWLASREQVAEEKPQMFNKEAELKSIILC
jgi:hypothetical protein